MACWTAYEAWDAYKRADYYQKDAEFWLERAREKGQEHNIYDPDRSTSTTKLLEKQKNETEAVSFVWFTTALLVLPLIGLIALKIFGWVWFGISTSARKNGTN